MSIFFRLRWQFKREKPGKPGMHLFCKTKTDYAYKLRVQDFATGKNFSFNQCSKQERFAFFSGKLFYKSNRKLFSCVCISWYKHSRGWENSRQLCKPSTSSRVSITVSNSPNPSRVYIRLCKQGNRFLLLNWYSLLGVTVIIITGEFQKPRLREHHKYKTVEYG